MKFGDYASEQFKTIEKMCDAVLAVAPHDYDGELKVFMNETRTPRDVLFILKSSESPVEFAKKMGVPGQGDEVRQLSHII